MRAAGPIALHCQTQVASSTSQRSRSDIPPNLDRDWGDGTITEASNSGISFGSTEMRYSHPSRDQMSQKGGYGASLSNPAVGTHRSRAAAGHNRQHATDPSRQNPAGLPRRRDLREGRIFQSGRLRKGSRSPQ